MTRLAVALALGLATVLPVRGAGLIEDYHVNAQYRGGVKKGFADIGTGKASYEPLGGAAFRVKVKGEVKHPKEDKTYAFNISQTFELSGNTVRLTGTERKELNEAAAPHENQIVEMIPFSYLARTLPPPPETGGDRSRSFTYNGQSYSMRYANTEKNLEISLYRGSDLLGKFFEAPQSSGQFAQLEKFRVTLPSEDLVVSFIVNNSMASR